MLDNLLYKIFYFIYQGFYTFEGPEKTRIILVKDLRPKWAAAQTLGNNIFVNYMFEPKEYFPHEYIHVLQYRKYGALFFLLYVLDSLKHFLKGKHYYYDNKFEAEAREGYDRLKHSFDDFEWPTKIEYLNRNKS
ncbi:MAG: hypothetical protein QXP88_01725 [Thermoproteota archaeon]